MLRINSKFSDVKFYVNFVFAVKNDLIIYFDEVLDMSGILKWYWGPVIIIIPYESPHRLALKYDNYYWLPIPFEDP